MRTRLAMVACYGPHNGPWLRARGNEVGIRVKCLGPGESVTAEWQTGSQTNSLKITADGDYPAPERFQRIHFLKEGGIKPTTVEIMVKEHG